MRAALSVTLGSFADSRIPEVNRLALLCGAVNLRQGFPDFPAPAAIEQACLAIEQDANQYTADLALCEAIADRVQARVRRMPSNPAGPTW